MHIASIETHPVRIPLKAAYRMISALGRHEESQFVLVRLLTDSGLEGAGEASATVRWSGETVWGVQSLIDRVLSPLLAGIELDPARPLESIAAIDGRMDRADTTDNEAVAWAWLTSQFDRLPLFRSVSLEANSEYYVRVRAHTAPRNAPFVWPWQGDDVVGLMKFTFIR